MARFDVADAALAGFGVIRSKPLAVLVWAVVLYVLAVLPAIGLIGAVISLARELPSLAESSGDARDVLHRMVGLQAGLLMGHPFASVGSLLVRVLLAAAVIRAVATPKDDRFFYLRFGRGELMLVLVTIVAAILMIAVMFASVLAIVALTLAAKARAFLSGRGYVTPQDVKSIGLDVLRHRVIISFEAEAEEMTSEKIVEQIFNGLPVP